MSVLLRGAISGVDADVDPTLRAFKVAIRQPEGDGFYAHSSRSGALAGAAAASIVWAARWTHATKVCVVDFLRIRALITTPFTAAQAWGFEGVVARGFSAALSAGGTTFLPSADGGNAFKRKTGYPTSNMAEIRMATTAALTGGTLAPDTSPFTNDFAWELAAGATVPRSKIYCEKDYGDGAAAPIYLVANEGILVRPTAALGAGGVVQLSVDVAWHEVDPTKL
jgi:hypothetical protein